MGNASPCSFHTSISCIRRPNGIKRHSPCPDPGKGQHACTPYAGLIYFQRPGRQRISDNHDREYEFAVGFQVTAFGWCQSAVVAVAASSGTRGGQGIGWASEVRSEQGQARTGTRRSEADADACCTRRTCGTGRSGRTRDDSAACADGSACRTGSDCSSRPGDHACRAGDDASRACDDASRACRAGNGGSRACRA